MIRAALALALLAATPAAAQPVKPDPGHIKFILPADIPWKGTPGVSQTYALTGDPNQPGPYVLLIKWWPGNFSRPHTHATTRYFTVISGTWWNSSSTVHDPSKTYPIPAGSVVVHEAGQVHWDGAKDEPTVIMVSGVGPAPTIQVDEQGKPK